MNTYTIEYMQDNRENFVQGVEAYDKNHAADIFLHTYGELELIAVHLETAE